MFISKLTKTKMSIVQPPRPMLVQNMKFDGGLHNNEFYDIYVHAPYCSRYDLR